LSKRTNRKEIKGGRTNTNSDPHVGISISISQKLLQNIEQNITGNSRSKKIENCIQIGYIELTSPMPLQKMETSGVERR